jgi:hypothetical protein
MIPAGADTHRFRWLGQIFPLDQLVAFHFAEGCLAQILVDIRR